MSSNNLFQRSDSKYWFCYLYDLNGKRVKRNTQCIDKEAALLKAKEFEREIANPKASVQAKATLGQALDLLIADRERTARLNGKEQENMHTVSFYKGTSKNLTKFFGNEFLLVNLDSTKVDEYIDYRRNKCKNNRKLAISPHTINKEIITLRGALKLAARAGLWAGNLGEVLPVKNSPEYKPRERYLTLTELRKLLHALATCRPSIGRDRAAFVAFCVATSARFSEAQHAQIKDIDVSGGFVTIYGTKTRTSKRTVPIVTEWQKEMIGYVLQHATNVRTGEPETSVIFQHWINWNCNRDIKKACVRAGILRASPNDLRRTCGTLLRMQGVPLELVSKVLGHKNSIITATVYAFLDDSSLKEQMQKALGANC